MDSDISSSNNEPNCGVHSPISETAITLPFPPKGKSCRENDGSQKIIQSVGTPDETTPKLAGGKDELLSHAAASGTASEVQKVPATSQPTELNLEFRPSKPSCGPDPVRPKTLCLLAKHPVSERSHVRITLIRDQYVFRTYIQGIKTEFGTRTNVPERAVERTEGIVEALRKGKPAAEIQKLLSIGERTPAERALIKQMPLNELSVGEVIAFYQMMQSLPQRKHDADTTARARKRDLRHFARWALLKRGLVNPNEKLANEVLDSVPLRWIDQKLWRHIEEVAALSKGSGNARKFIERESKTLGSVKKMFTHVFHDRLEKNGYDVPKSFLGLLKNARLKFAKPKAMNVMNHTMADKVFACVQEATGAPEAPLLALAALGGVCASQLLDANNPSAWISADHRLLVNGKHELAFDSDFVRALAATPFFQRTRPLSKRQREALVRDANARLRPLFPPGRGPRSLLDWLAGQGQLRVFQRTGDLRRVHEASGLQPDSLLQKFRRHSFGSSVLTKFQHCERLIPHLLARSL